jgi:hypothetical protein
MCLYAMRMYANVDVSARVGSVYWKKTSRLPLEMLTVRGVHVDEAPHQLHYITGATETRHRVLLCPRLVELAKKLRLGVHATTVPIFRDAA